MNFYLYFILSFSKIIILFVFSLKNSKKSILNQNIKKNNKQIEYTRQNKHKVNIMQKKIFKQTKKRLNKTDLLLFNPRLVFN